MEKVLTNEMSKFLIILGVGVIGLSAVMVKMVTRLTGSFTPYKKVSIFYVLISLLLFALIALTAKVAVFNEPITLFIFYQACFLLFGILHFYCMHQFLNWSGDEKSFWTEVLFSLIVGMFGSIAFAITYRLFNDNGLEFLMSTSIIFLLVPLFVYHTFRKAVSIPPKIIKLWFYPVHEEMDEPDENKMKNLLLISFVFQKLATDTHYTSFRARAPNDMEFGELFYYFINDYNERHPHSKIEYIGNNGEPHGWIFYEKPRWYSVFTHYINPENTIFINRIRENDVIICSRSLN